VVSQDLVAGLAKEDPADVGGPVHKVVADWLRISASAKGSICGGS
jgi:hypothetical protein